MLEGIQGPEWAGSAGARRRWLFEAPIAEVADAIIDALPRHQEAAARFGPRLAIRFGVPEAELLASPFAFRTALLAACTPTIFVPLELRAPEPGLARCYAEAGMQDEMHMRWQDGRLGIGKYESFRQDDLVLVHNPNHHAKWTPHELLHRVHGYFWREDASAFEHYRAARLNELAPVALWYGLDEILRLDGRPFRRGASFAEPECTMDRVQWLHAQPESLRPRVLEELERAREALRHFERELEAVEKEGQGGRPLPVGHDFLDSSSDSLAYVKANASRLTDERFVLREACLGNPFAQRVETVAEMHERVVRDWDRLVFGELNLYIPEGISEVVQKLDLVHRSVFAADALSEELASSWRAVGEGACAYDAEIRRTAFGQGAPESAGARRGEEAPRLVSCLCPSVDAAALLASGAGEASWFELLDAGMADALPATWRWLAHSGKLKSFLQDFARSGHLRRRVSLARRVCAFLEEEGDPIPLSLSRFEDALAQSAQEPGWLPIAADVPWSAEELAGGLLRANEHFRICTLALDVLDLHDALLEAGELSRSALEAALPAERGLPAEVGTTLLMGSEGGALRVTTPPSAVISLFEKCMEEGLTPEAARTLLQAAGMNDNDASAWPFELVLLGALTWVPPEPAL